MRKCISSECSPSTYEHNLDILGKIPGLTNALENLLSIDDFTVSFETLWVLGNLFSSAEDEYTEQLLGSQLELIPKILLLA